MSFTVTHRDRERLAVVPENPIRRGSRLKENQGNILNEACDPPTACDGRRRSVQTAAAAGSREPLSSSPSAAGTLSKKASGGLLPCVLDQVRRRRVVKLKDLLTGEKTVEAFKPRE
jgi:hypothetical protein